VRIKPFQAVYPNFDLIASADSFFGTVKYQYRDYEKDGFFKQTSGNSLYVYAIKSPTIQRLGLLASVDINDYIEGKILKHETTLSTKEQSMINLLLHRRAMIKPILLTYPKSKKIDAFLDKIIKRESLYSIHFDLANEDHIIWSINDPKEIELAKSLFANIDKVYIADGHHRCSTSAILNDRKDAKKLNLDFSQMLCAFMSFDQVAIYDYNRVVQILNEISPTELIARIAKYCKIKKKNGSFRPQRKHDMSFLINKEWYQLTWRKKVLDQYKNEPVILDATILTDMIFHKILNITSVREDKRIKYIEGTLGEKGIYEACLKREHCVGFGLYPVLMEEFKKLSDLGEVLPPKSTWFEPRMKNGFISQEF
jgi:uncharacterized protein (DUF1015 family)